MDYFYKQNLLTMSKLSQDVQSRSEIFMDYFNIS